MVVYENFQKWEFSGRGARSAEQILEKRFPPSSRKYYYYRRSIGDLSETQRRRRCLIGDLDMHHLRDMPDRRPRHASSKTNMPDRRPTKDRHTPLVTDIPHRRLTCLNGDLNMLQLVTHLKMACPVGDPSETNMPHGKPI